MTPAELKFAQQMVAEAQASDHPFPGYAAAEAFLESASYSSPSGQSGLAQRTRDVFGLKVPSWWDAQVFDEQTREVINGVSKMMDAEWPVFTSYADAFQARLKVLQNLPIYAEALAATTGPEFVRLVSASWNSTISAIGTEEHPVFTFPSGLWQFNAERWSSAPNRATEVLNVYNGSLEVFEV